MTPIFESDIEEYLIELLQNQGFDYLSPEQQEAERLPAFGADKPDLSQVVLLRRLKNAVETLNPTIPDEAKGEALKQVLNLPSHLPASAGQPGNLVDNNEAFHRMLTEGIEVEFMVDGNLRGDKVWLIDWQDVLNNEFLVCNQFTVIENNINKRPDVVLFVNGLPLVVIELKNPADENATVAKAFTQLQNYKNAIPSLFYYNEILLASDGFDAKAGTISSDFGRFAAWKSVDGLREDSPTVPQIETLVKGMLKKDVLLDLIKQFIVFEKTKNQDSKTGLTSVETIKKLAAYHQYFAVNKAVESTISATSQQGSRKAGIIWHTQGSGKSLSMVFYTGKIVLELNNPTVVVVTDRNDLDGQLFDTFAGCRQLLRQEPVQAKSIPDLKTLLKTAGGGIVFTTIQKFSPVLPAHGAQAGEGQAVYDLLSERKNIVVIADEAHRSHYGFIDLCVNNGTRHNLSSAFLKKDHNSDCWERI